jgi:hypothetical protein
MMPATCMLCGRHRDCIRVADIGWVCLHCVYRNASDDASTWKEYRQPAGGVE